jgi:hypothetical protein
MSFTKAVSGAALLGTVGLTFGLGLTGASGDGVEQAGLGVAPPAHLQRPTPGVASDGHDYTNQFATGEFTQWIYNQADVEKIGYAGQVNHNQDLRVEIYWKGTSGLKDQIAAEGQRRGIQVEFKPARFTAEEQVRIGKKLMNQQARFAEEGIDLGSVVGFSGEDGRMKVVGHSNQLTHVLGLDPTEAKLKMKSLVREVAGPEIAAFEPTGLEQAKSTADAEIDTLFDDPKMAKPVNLAGR